jgi:hypothetical protein
VNAAVEAAHRAFQTDWRWRTPAERAALLLEFAGEVLQEHQRRPGGAAGAEPPVGGSVSGVSSAASLLLSVAAAVAIVGSASRARCLDVDTEACVRALADDGAAADDCYRESIERLGRTRRRARRRARSWPRSPAPRYH